MHVCCIHTRTFLYDAMCQPRSCRVTSHARSICAMAIRFASWAVKDQERSENTRNRDGKRKHLSQKKTFLLEIMCYFKHLQKPRKVYTMHKRCACTHKIPHPLQKVDLKLIFEKQVLAVHARIARHETEVCCVHP